MGADPRVRLIAIEEAHAKLVDEVRSLEGRIAQLERVIVALTRSNAGKEKRVGA